MSERSLQNIVSLVRDIKTKVEKKTSSNTERINALEDKTDVLFEFTEMFFYVFSRATAEGVFLEDDAQVTFKKLVKLEKEYFAVLAVGEFIRKLR